jgi:predicted N-acetyltransferase YhbS
MSPSVMTIRPPETPAEIAAFFQLAAQTFVRDAAAACAAVDWRRFVEGAPDHHPGHIRGAFRDNTYVGGYLIEERRLRVGSARLRVGCIGAVVTHPDYRRQGIGSALMQDALAYARARDYALLLLNGAAHFYDPFGYIDVFDATTHALGRAQILAQPSGPYRVRSAAIDDAPAMLALYQRHYGPYTGSFERTLEQQEHHLRYAHSLQPQAYHTREGLSYTVPVLALDPLDRPRGYLTFPWGPLCAFGCEVAADDWSAALALLQYHARLLDTLPDPPDDLQWPLPPDCSTFYHLSDHLPVRSQAYHRPHAGWMARPIDVLAAVRSLLGLWQDRWQRCAAGWSGILAFTVGDASVVLQVEPAGIRLLERPASPARTISLSPQVFVQLLFGYRPASWTAGQPGQRVPRDLVPLLTTLFPPSRAWIAPTDGC